MREDSAPRPGRPRDDDRVAEARRLRDEEHLSDRDIAARLGIARTTVTRWLGPARSPGRPPADLGSAPAAREAGASWREVEQQAGVAKSTAHRRAAAGGTG